MKTSWLGTARRAASVGARPAQEKKGADKGVDGRIYFHEALTGGSHPRMQIITVADLLGGRGIDYPGRGHAGTTYRQAPKVKLRDAQPTLEEAATYAAEEPAPYPKKRKPTSN